MVPIDVTNLSNREREAVGSSAMDLEMVPDGYPIAKGKSRNKKGSFVIDSGTSSCSITDNPKNAALLKKYGPKVFSKKGKVMWNRIPKDDFLKKLSKMETETLMRRFRQVGTPYVKALRKYMDKSDLKTKTITKLDVKMNNFIKSPHSASKSGKATKKSGKKLPSERKKMGPVEMGDVKL
jgi:hypothetical protein